MTTAALMIAALVLWLAPVGRDGRHRVGRRADRFVRRRWVIVAAAGVLGAVIAPLPSLLAAAGGALVLRWRRRSAVDRSRAELDDSVPEVADLLGVVVGAGGTVADAVELVAERAPAPARPAFAAVLADADRGLGLVSALQRADLPPSFRPLLAGLVSAERDGAPLGVVVARLADGARAARAARIRARVQRLPVLLLAPLTLCCLPAVLIGAVVPVALAHLGSIGL